MKRVIALMLAAMMVVPMVACGQTQSGGNSGSQATSGSQTTGGSGSQATTDVEMKYMTGEELTEVLGQDGYLVLDVRKAADYETSHIPGAVSADMDAAVNGDTEAGIETMTAATEGVDDTIVLVCYSGKKYAQASTNALSEIGYDMDKVFTLEGGFNGWTEAYPDNVES